MFLIARAGTERLLRLWFGLVGEFPHDHVGIHRVGLLAWRRVRFRKQKGGLSLSYKRCCPRRLALSFFVLILCS